MNHDGRRLGMAGVEAEIQTIGRGRVAPRIGRDHDGAVLRAVDGTVHPTHGRPGEPHTYGTIPSMDLLELARLELARIEFLGLERVRLELILRLARPRGLLVGHHR